MSLECFFNPKSIAVIGASSRVGSIGYVILDNLVKKFKGKVYPVNPKYSEIFGLKCYPTIKDIEEQVDLAVIAVRAEIVPRIMEDCSVKGVKCVIIISAGFSEIGPEGAERERKVLEIARKSGIRVIGPNCIGIFDNISGIDTFFLPEDKLRRPPRGYIGIISQSGALLSMWLDWMALKELGVSRAISYGNKADVDDVDLLEYLENDPKTKIILLYIESLKENRGSDFLKVAKRVSRKKPIIVLKGGRTAKGMAAASSHTGALAGSYEVYRTAFRQAGIIEVDTMEEMFDVAKAFLYLKPLKGNRILILTNAGGEGVLAADYAERYGLEVPELPDDIQSYLKSIFPPHVIVKNPVDVTGDADDERYKTVLDTVLPRGVVDGVLLIIPPHPPTIKGDIIQYAAEAYKKYGIPVVVVCTGGQIALEFSKKFEEAGLPTYNTPERGIQVLAALAKYGAVLRNNQH